MAGRKLVIFLLRGDPASEIPTHLNAQGVDLIVAGFRGFSALAGWWWNSVSRKSVHYVHNSVLFVQTEIEGSNGVNTHDGTTNSMDEK